MARGVRIGKVCSVLLKKASIDQFALFNLTPAVSFGATTNRFRGPCRRAILSFDADHENFVSRQGTSPDAWLRALQGHQPFKSP